MEGAGGAIGGVRRRVGTFCTLMCKEAPGKRTFGHEWWTSPEHSMEGPCEAGIRDPKEPETLW